MTSELRAEIVVVGGGVAGCSVAYHLADAGARDVMLIEKSDLTSGSTHHAAGLVTQFNPSPAMMRFRRYSVDLYRRLGVFETVGSLRIASSKESLLDLQRAVSRARGIGLEASLVTPAEVLRLLPQASPASLFGAVWMPEDGYVDPHIATYALASAARELGVRIVTHTCVTGIDLDTQRAVRAVLTDSGRIETECVVNACGIWAPQLAAMAGTRVVSVPVDHQHITLRPVEGHELPHGMPCFRDTDNLVYGKAETGGITFGGYEPNPVARWIDGVPWEHDGRALSPDHERFAQLMAGAVRRFPFLEDAGVVSLVCHPDAMTPDGNPLLGPIPGTRGLWAAAGLSLNGFGGAGGLGKAAAELILTGDTELDVNGYRPWRFGGSYSDPSFAAETAREVYKYYYRLRYPLDVAEWGRPKRLSALHGRLHERGAVFVMKNGWERADYFVPGRESRRAGEEQRTYGWEAPPQLALVAQEHEAIRERVGIVDLSSFGKIEVEGPGALGLLQRVCDNDVDRAPGSVIYTQFLDRRGGIVGDVTVTRLDIARFLVITGAGSIASDLGWLTLNVRGGEPAVSIRDASHELSTIGIWGPMARSVLGAVTGSDVSNEAFPYRTARKIDVGIGNALAQRITYVGELGFEIYVSPDAAVQMWDRLMEAGDPRPVGYAALESLRIEKGYRALGTDLASTDTPYEAGLGFCVALGKGEFNGRDALVDKTDPGRKLRTLVVGDEDYVTMYGGEAVQAEGRVVGRVRSCAYGFTVKRNVALATLPVGLREDAKLEVEIFGSFVPARIAPDVLYDPDNVRVRS